MYLSILDQIINKNKFMGFVWKLSVNAIVNLYVIFTFTYIITTEIVIILIFYPILNCSVSLQKYISL